MSVFKLKNFQYHSLYKIGLILIAIGLPLSRFLMSLGGIFLIVSWLLKGRFKEAFRSFWDNKPALAISGIFIINTIGLINSVNMSYGIKDLKIKLPLLIYPMVMSSMSPISKKFWKLVFYFFLGACFIGSLHSSLVYFGIIDIGRNIKNYRDAFIFVSHIRFSLFICLSIFVLAYYWLKEGNNKNKLNLYLLPAIWFTLYIFLLGIPTGVLVLLIGGIIFLSYQTYYVKNHLIKTGLFILIILIPLSSYLYIRHCVKEYYNVENVNWETLERKTPNGNDYFHNKESKRVESGHYVWIYVCEEELRQEWNKRGNIKYDSLDKAGQKIKGTILRYLTSKGLRKDSIGVSMLNQSDINYIERGIANVNYINKVGIRKKIDQSIFQFDNYLSGGNPSGNSLTQKLEFWRASLLIIKENFWFGVGTGDVQEAFDQAYENIESPLNDKYRLRAHNQFLTMFISLGVFGFLLFVFFHVFPFVKRRNFINLPYLMFFFVVSISFITEDTLETQAGATFYAFFSCFFLLFREDQ